MGKLCKLNKEMENWKYLNFTLVSRWKDNYRHLIQSLQETALHKALGIYANESLMNFIENFKRWILNGLKIEISHWIWNNETCEYKQKLYKVNIKSSYRNIAWMELIV